MRRHMFAVVFVAFPLATVFAARVGELTEADMQWAQAEARRLGLGQ